jgi:hypothetical protein
MRDLLQGAGDFALGLGILVGAIVQFLNWFTQRRNAEKIAELTMHTNGIKDALVAVTGSAEHAKGVLAGRAEIIDEQRKP